MATTHDRHQLRRWQRRCFANHYLETGTIHLLPHPLGAVISYTELTTDQAENPKSDPFCKHGMGTSIQQRGQDGDEDKQGDDDDDDEMSREGPRTLQPYEGR